MPSLRSMLLVGLPLAASNFAHGQPASNEDNVNEVAEWRRAVSKGEGVGRNAIARAVDSAMEESVFKRYLWKRQNSNTTSVSTVTDIITSTVSLSLDSSTSSPQASPPSSSDDVPSSTAPVVVDPTSDPVTSNPPSSDSVPPTTAALPSETTFAVIDSSGSVVTSVPDRATISNMVLTSPTPGGIYTGTEPDGNVVIVTYTPDGGTISEVRFLTTTLPNGSQSLITSYATVGAPANPTGGSSDSGPSGNEPQLQSGAAVPSTWYAAELAIMFGAAVGAAAIML